MPPPKPPKLPKLSREAVTLAGGIYALAVAKTLETQVPTEVKLKQLSDGALAAAQHFEPLLIEAMKYDREPDEEQPPAPSAPVPPLTTRG